jgi:hypothetical protein
MVNLLYDLINTPSQEGIRAAYTVIGISEFVIGVLLSAIHTSSLGRRNRLPLPLVRVFLGLSASLEIVHVNPLILHSVHVWNWAIFGVQLVMIGSPLDIL